MTYQTAEPVERLSLNATNRLASELARFYTDGRLTADLPYQRGAVWTYGQRIELVKSWLSGTQSRPAGSARNWWSPLRIPGTARTSPSRA